jgi:hypothetical protein
MPGQSDIIQPGVYASGTIASLQNDKDGKPPSLVAGLWRGSLTNMSCNDDVVIKRKQYNDN